MNATIQNRINPHVAQSGKTFNDLKVEDQRAAVNKDETTTQVDFKDLLTNSNAAKKEERLAADDKDMSKLSQGEFLEKMREQSKPQRKPRNKLDKDDFMKLFVEQLKNQDPLNPDKGAEMAAKLAQFNSLEQMMNSNKNLNTLIDAQKQDRNLQLLNYVGKEVNLDGGFVKIASGQVLPQDFNTDIDVASAKLVIRNSSGSKKTEVDLGSLQRGVHKVNWDGKDQSGKVLPDGVYKFSIEAKSLTNQQVDIPLSTRARITGIDLKDSKDNLYTEYGRMGLDKLKAVGSEGFNHVVDQKSSVAVPPSEAEALADPRTNSNQGTGLKAPPIKNISRQPDPTMIKAAKL